MSSLNFYLIYGLRLFNVSHHRITKKYDYWKEPNAIPACFMDGEIEFAYLGPHKGLRERTQSWLCSFLTHFPGR